MNVTHEKEDLIKCLSDSNKAKLVALVICRNNDTIDAFAGDYTKDCKALANELIEDVLTVDLGSEKIIYESTLKAILTSQAPQLSFRERGNNLFSTLFKLLNSKCPDLIDFNMECSEHIMSRYTHIDDDELKRKILVYAIITQHLSLIDEIANCLPKNKSPNAPHFDLTDKEDKIVYEPDEIIDSVEKTDSDKEKTEEVITMSKYRKDKLKDTINNNKNTIKEDNKEEEEVIKMSKYRVRKVNKNNKNNASGKENEVIVKNKYKKKPVDNNEPIIVPETSAIPAIPEESESIKDVTVINSDKDEKQTSGNYNQETPAPAPTTRRTPNEAINGGIDSMISDIETIMGCKIDENSRIALMKIMRMVFEMIRSGADKNKVLQELYTKITGTNLDLQFIPSALLHVQTQVTALYEDLELIKSDKFLKDVETIVTSLDSLIDNSVKVGIEAAKNLLNTPEYEELVSVLSPIVENTSKSETKKPEVKPSTNRVNGFNTGLTSILDKINSKKYNGKLTTVVKEYKGPLNLDELELEFTRELQSLGALDVIDKTVEVLNINISELVYTLFAMKSKKPVATRVKQQVYSVLINRVINNHPKKNNLTTAIVDTLLKNKGSYDMSVLFPYTPSTKVKNIDETINNAMALFNGREEDLTA